METCLDGSGFLLREKGDPRVISDLSLYTTRSIIASITALSRGA